MKVLFFSRYFEFYFLRRAEEYFWKSIFLLKKKKEIKGKRLSFNYRANNKPVAYQEQCIFSVQNKRSIFKINY